MKVINKQQLIDSLIWISVSFLYVKRDNNALISISPPTSRKYYVSLIENTQCMFVLSIDNKSSNLSHYTYDELSFEVDE